MSDTAVAIDAEGVRAWLDDVLDEPVSSVTVDRMAGGYSSGAWLVDAIVGGARRSMVLKAPETPSVVYERDAAREARILDAAGRFGAPVPEIIAIDDGARAVGRPCFVMEHVDGRSVPDAGAPPEDDWFGNAGPEVQLAVWSSFYDALAGLHAVDATPVAGAGSGPDGSVGYLDYWRRSLLDAAPAHAVPRQLAVLDWLRDHLPPDADDAPAVCMGDARLVNCLFDGTDARALVDFEVAYRGNPAADVGYSLFVDEVQEAQPDLRLTIRPSTDETWARWSCATGRPASRPEYWTAFGATILCVTATRWMLLWGFSDVAGVEAANPLVTRWEATVAAAPR